MNFSKNIDWYRHYQKKLPRLNFHPQDLNIFYQQNKPLIDVILSLNSRAVIEAGSGLARDSFVLASKGISVTLFDINARLLKIAQENAKKVDIEVETIQGDLLTFSRYIAKSKYDLSFNCGVLEHFNDDEIHRIIDEQLMVVPIVVFTVPVYSERNLAYFNDMLYRRLLPIDEWKKILSSYLIADFRPIEVRHDDLLVVLKQK
jgi:SAM-dependent methyltransferase